MDAIQYTQFEWECDHDQIETCFDSAKTKLRTMYPNNRVDSCDMFGLYIFDSEDNLIAQYSTGIINDGDFAMQNIETKEVRILCAAL